MPTNSENFWRLKPLIFGRFLSRELIILTKRLFLKLIATRIEYFRRDLDTNKLWIVGAFSPLKWIFLEVCPLKLNAFKLKFFFFIIKMILFERFICIKMIHVERFPLVPTFREKAIATRKSCHYISLIYRVFQNKVHNLKST